MKVSPFGNLRSPGTLRNLRARPAIEVNFVDPFVRKGYRFAGTAELIEREAPTFGILAPAFADYGDSALRMRAIVRIGVLKVLLPITSPAYDLMTRLGAGSSIDPAPHCRLRTYQRRD